MVFDIKSTLDVLVLAYDDYSNNTLIFEALKDQITKLAR